MPNSAHSIQSAVFAACRKSANPLAAPVTNARPAAMVAGEPARVPPNANSVSGEFHGQFQQPRRFRVWRHCHGARDRLIQLLAAALNDLQQRQSKPVCDTPTSSRLSPPGWATMGRCRRDQSAPGLIRAAAVVVVVIALPLLILTSCPANRDGMPGRLAAAKEETQRRRARLRWRCSCGPRTAPPGNWSVCN